MQFMTPASSLTGPALPHPLHASSTTITTLTNAPNNAEHIPATLTTTPSNGEQIRPTPAIGAGNQEVEMTAIRNGADVTPSQMEANNPRTTAPALHKRAAAYIKALAQEHKLGLQIAGWCFAVAMFVLELWGRINGLVQDN